MKVLIVDDRADVRETFAGALEMRGHHVVQAPTSQDALDRYVEADADGSPFEVAIIDWDLGLLSNENGPALVRAFKDIEPTMGICLWSGLTRDPVEEADIQIVKGLKAIDELLDWLTYEEGVQQC